jgi:hypothetical protein
VPLSPLTLLGLAAAGAYFLRRNGGSVMDKGDGSGMVPVPAGGARGANVFNREVARGVHPNLHTLLDDWQNEGWFDVVVASGVRTQAQQTANFKAGLTRASDVKTTPHGYGAALDIHPSGFDDTRCFVSQPEMLAKMNTFGTWAKTKGFIWGGDWKGKYVNGVYVPASFSPACWEVDHVEGDRPHVEMVGWRTMQYPPPNYWSPY